jgi:hypothetical protein
MGSRRGLQPAAHRPHQRIHGSYTLVELSKGAESERWPAAVRGQLIGIAQTAIPSDVERPTSASVHATAKMTF